MNSMSNPASQKNNSLNAYNKALHEYMDLYVMPIIKQAVSTSTDLPKVKTFLAPNTTPRMIFDELLPECNGLYLPDAGMKSIMFEGFKKAIKMGDATFHFTTDYSSFMMKGFQYTNDHDDVADVTLFLMGDIPCNHTYFDPECDASDYEDGCWHGSSWAVPMFHVRFKNGKNVIGPCCVVEVYDIHDKNKCVGKRRACYEMYEWYTSRP